MRCSLDKVLLDARQLANRIRATDETADMLIKQASDAHNKVIAKKQCQEEIMSFEDLNQISKTRPRSRLMMCIAAENKQLELLKQENKVLRTSLNEYETTFEMIMRKFRKHKNILKKLDELEKKGDFVVSSSSFIPPPPQSDNNSSVTENQILSLCWKITQLQKAIEQALIVDNKVTDDLSEMETKLLFENQELRRLIEINEEFKNDLLLLDDYSNECIRSQSSLQKIVLCVDNSSLSNLPRENFASFSSNSSNSSSSSSSVLMINGILPKEKLFSSTKLKFPHVNNHHNNSSSSARNSSDFLNNSIIVIPENGSTFCDDDDDDDHSSVASDASVKTLI